VAVNDTLDFWHPRQDRKVPDDWFEWGVVARGSSADKQFRVRNLSSHYTAVDVIVSLDQLGIHDPALEVDVQHLLSRDGRSYFATVNIGNLIPRAVSPLITLRRVTSRDADEGPGEFQLSAAATDWT
jgi:hypothetical protein